VDARDGSSDRSSFHEDPEQALRELVRAELETPVRENVEWLAGELRARHGETVLGVLFYGSCLRKQTDEGVLDFWVVVDDYRKAHASALHALANRFAPPSVYYLERAHAGQTLRTKYGVIDRRAFAAGTAFAAWHPYIWARFAQPARLIAARDEQSRRDLEALVAQAIVTFCARLFVHLPDNHGLFRFSLSAFWQEAFRRTYDSERRPEADESIRGLYLEDEARYDAAATAAFQHLTRAGFFAEASQHPRSFAIRLAPRRLALLRLRWRLMRPYARTLGLVRLLRTAFTFGDWVPYVLWKLERHTGRRIELTPRQRAHPLIFAWPIILPLLLKRNLRES
jgi:hypothetical protein